MSGASAILMDHFMQARMHQEQQRLRAEQADRQAAELAARQKAAEMEAARQAIAMKVLTRKLLPTSLTGHLPVLSQCVRTPYKSA